MDGIITCLHSCDIGQAIDKDKAIILAFNAQAVIEDFSDRYRKPMGCLEAERHIHIHMDRIMCAGSLSLSSLVFRMVQWRDG